MGEAIKQVIEVIALSIISLGVVGIVEGMINGQTKR